MKTQNNKKMVFAVYANALADQVGFEFRFANVSTASCGRTSDGKTIITLPLLPMEMTEEEMNKYLGLTAHEVQHENSTDFGFITKANAVHELAAHLLNVYEDIRIEGEFGRKFFGGRSIINNMAAALAKEGFYNHPGPNANAGSIVSQFILQRLNVDVLGQPLSAFADSWEAAFEQSFTPLVKARIRHVMGKAKDMVTTEDAYDLAIETLNILISASQKPEPKEEDKKQESNSSSQSSSDAQDDEQQQSSSSQPGSDAQDDEQQQSSSSQPGSDEQDEEQEFDSSAEQALSTRSQDIDLPDKHKLLDAKNISVEGEKMPAQSVNGALFSGYPRKHWIQTARKSSNALIQQLTALLQNDQARGGKKKARFGKRMNSRALTSAVVGGDSSGLYSKKAKGKDAHADVHILIDCSYSMTEGNEIQTASQAAMALMMSLEKVPNVNTEVSGFTGCNNANHHQIKGGSTDEKMIKLSSIMPVHMNNTPTCDGILGAIASMNLNVQSDKRLLFVIQDGGGYPRESLDIAKRNDIDVIGIGIGYDVSDMYPYSIYINDINELAPKMFSLMRTKLVA